MQETSTAPPEVQSGTHTYTRSPRHVRRARRRRCHWIIGALLFVILVVSVMVSLFPGAPNEPGDFTNRNENDDPTNNNVENDYVYLEFPHQVVLASNQIMKRGEFVSSPSGEFLVGMDTNGDLILEDDEFNVIWSAGTVGGVRASMQSDGNLVVRDDQRKALWSSKSSGNPGSIFVVDDGGMIAVVKGSTPIWLHGIPRGQYKGPSSNDLPFPLRGIFYYPWFPQTWTVNGKTARFPPDIGLYSSSDPQVAKRHVEAMDYGHIDVAIASWWGPDTNLDRARLSLLMNQTLELESALKWTVYHEDELELQPSVEFIRNDLDYLKKWFAWHPTWAHIDGKPVIFVYNGGGCDIVERWMDASNGEWFVVIKIFPKYRDCARQPDHWHQYGVNGGEPLYYDSFSFSLAPGFWRADEANARAPRVSVDQWCENVELMANSDEDLHLIISFNEAGEGTNIETSPIWASDSGHGQYLDCLHQFPTGGRSED